MFPPYEYFSPFKRNAPYSIWRAFVDSVQTLFSSSIALSVLLQAIALGLFFLACYFVMGAAAVVLSHWLLTLDPNIMDPNGALSQSLDHIDSFALALLFSLSLACGLAYTLVGVIVTPWAMGIIVPRKFPNLARLGILSTRVSWLNAIKVALIFMLGFALTSPLMLVPGLGIVLRICWYAYLYSHIASVDALCEHATEEERRHILRRCRPGFFAIGLTCAAIEQFINLSILSIPILAIIMPIMAILACIHYGLAQLEQQRQTELPLPPTG